jgi:hypothetical protein
MRKQCWLGCGSAAVFLGVTLPIAAQLPGLTGARSVPAKQQAAVQGVKVAPEDYNRLMEILVELAWLADPATCAGLLEAHVDGAGLRVKGHVSDRSVHARALQIARLHCPMPVVDGLKEDGHTAGRPARIAAQQLQRAALTSLQASFPQATHAFKILCDANGKVRVSGFVVSFEEKLAVSQELRRLHGCSCVLNEAHVSSDLHEPARAAKAPSPALAPPVAAAAGRPASAGAIQQTRYLAPAQPVQRKNAAPAPAGSLGASYVSRGVVVLPETAVASTEKTAVLRRRIAQTCGIDAGKIKLEVTSGNILDIQLAVANQAECNRLIQRIRHMPDVAAYRLQIHMKTAD